jgi:Flp pilus assembly protein TadD
LAAGGTARRPLHHTPTLQAQWLNQDFTGPYVLLGKVELNKGDPDLAVQFLERAIKMEPNNYMAHYLLGSAYKKMGRPADADRELRLTQTLRPEPEIAR